MSEPEYYKPRLSMFSDPNPEGVIMRRHGDGTATYVAYPSGEELTAEEAMRRINGTRDEDNT